MAQRFSVLRYARHSPQVRGATLIEALITILVLGVLTAIAAPNVTGMGSVPLPDTTDRIAGQFRAARVKAIAQTSAFRIRPSGSSITEFIVERSTSCTATTWTRDNTFTSEDLTFGKNISMSRSQINPVPGNDGDRSPVTDWTLCYNNRGIADRNLIVTLRQSTDLTTRRIEIFPGGTVQIYDN